jgi:large subunit ribosomal protein L25
MDWFLAYYTEEIRQFISQQKLWLSKNLVYTQTLTVEIDLEKENHLTLFYKTFKFQCLTRFYTLTFQIFDDKEITMEVPVKIIGNSKELWQVEIYV